MDNFTASGFHVLRAVERTIQRFFSIVLPDKLAAKTKPLDEENWGYFVREFRASSDPDARKVAELLQQIKDQDRNLIMHPHESLNEDDALSLFDLARAAIIVMASRLPQA